jgi:hypothetical protein
LANLWRIFTGDFYGERKTHVATEKNDQSVLNHIDQLVKEEEHLYGEGELSADDRGRLAELKVALDQCWDLLRQRGIVPTENVIRCECV